MFEYNLIWLGIQSTPKNALNCATEACIWLTSLRACRSGPLPKIFITAAVVRATRTAMMAITTTSSTSVKAARRPRGLWLSLMVVRPRSVSVVRRNNSRGSLPRTAGESLLLAQAVQQLEQRHEQGDDDGADEQAEDHDHDRLQQADQALDQDVDLLVVHVGDLVEHRVQVARLLADVDHVDHHVVHQPALLERLGDGVALADRLVDALVHAFKDGVGARLADDGQRLQDRHARRHQRAQRARGAGHDGLLDQRADDGYVEVEPVQRVRPALVEAYQLDQQPEAEREQRQDVPVGGEPPRRCHQHLGQLRQLHLEVLEDLLELRDDVDHDEGQDQHRHQDDHDGVDHGPG